MAQVQTGEIELRGETGEELDTWGIVGVDIGISSDVHRGVGIVLSQGFHHSNESSQGQYKLVILATGWHVHTDVSTGGQARDGQEEREDSS